MKQLSITIIISHQEGRDLAFLTRDSLDSIEAFAINAVNQAIHNKEIKVSPVQLGPYVTCTVSSIIADN